MYKSAYVKQRRIKTIKAKVMDQIFLQNINVFSAGALKKGANGGWNVGVPCTFEDEYVKKENEGK
jgi:hypothetical protein